MSSTRWRSSTQYGTDAFRFTLAAFAAQGRDIKLAEERIAGYRNFCNKIWNAARFTLMNLEGFDPDGITLESLELAQGDRWILHRLNETARIVDETLAGYRFNEAPWRSTSSPGASSATGTWNSPSRTSTTATPERKLATQYVLWYTLENLLRLLHPFMPFITEEIWQALPGTQERPSPTIMQAAYPDCVRAPQLPRGGRRYGTGHGGHRRHPQHPRRDGGAPLETDRRDPFLRQRREPAPDET